MKYWTFTELFKVHKTNGILNSTYRSPLDGSMAQRASSGLKQEQIVIKTAPINKNIDKKRLLMLTSLQWWGSVKTLEMTDIHKWTHRHTDWLSAFRYNCRKRLKNMTIEYNNRNKLPSVQQIVTHSKLLYKMDHYFLDIQ